MAASVAASVVWLTVAVIMTDTPALASGLVSMISAALAVVGAPAFFGSGFFAVTGAFDGAATGVSITFVAGLALLGALALAAGGAALALAFGAGLVATLVALFGAGLGVFAFGAGFAAAGFAAGLATTFAADFSAGLLAAVFFAGGVGVFTGFFITFAMDQQATKLPNHTPPIT